MELSHLVWPAVVLLAVAIVGFVALRLIAVWVRHRWKPAENTVKGRENDIAHRRALAKIETEAFLEKLRAISALPLSVQPAALKVLLVSIMTHAGDWRVFGLGGTAEGSLVHSLLRTVAVSDTVVDELRQTKLWPQVEPLLRNLLEKAGATPGHAKLAAAPSVPVSAPPSKKSIGDWLRGK